MNKKTIQQFYDAESKQYLAIRPWLNYYVGPRIARFIRLWLKNFYKNEVILHVGCGPGWLEESVLSDFDKLNYIAIDFSKNMVHELKKHMPKVDAVIADAENLPFRRNSVKGIIIGRAIKFIHPEKFFDQANMTLKDKGLIGVIFDSGDALWIQIIERAGRVVDGGIRKKTLRSFELKEALDKHDFQTSHCIPITRLQHHRAIAHLARFSYGTLALLDVFLKHGRVTVIFGLKITNTPETTRRNP